MYFKPMLADHVILERLKYPVLCSTKLDGIRCINYHGRAISRSLKAIPNSHIQKMFFKYLRDFPNLDGELIVGNPTSTSCFRDTTSGVMGESGTPDFHYYVFDVIPPEESLQLTYSERMNEWLLEKLCKIPFVVIVPQIKIETPEELFELEKNYVDSGYEGLIIRHDLPYKFGRSTNKEGILLKLKRYADSEAVILDCQPLLKNENEASRDELGKIHRSNKMGGMVEKELLGSFIVKDLTTNVVFSVGSGFTDEEKYNLWKNRLVMPGKIIKYKYFPVGQKEAPRHPVFLGFRDKKDM